jgi:hypothetical protein
VDKRAILAVILALKERGSFLLKYGDVEDALEGLVEDEDEYDEVRGAFYDLLFEQKLHDVRNLKHIYYVYEDEYESSSDRIIVAPTELNNEQLRVVEEVISILDYLPHEDGGDDEEAWGVINTVVNALVRKWASEKYECTSFAYTAYVLAKAYGLSVRVIDSDSPYGRASEDVASYVLYGIEDTAFIRWHGPAYCRVPGYSPPTCGTWEFAAERG